MPLECERHHMLTARTSYFQTSQMLKSAARDAGYTYIYIYIYICIHTYVCVYIYIYMYIHICCPLARSEVRVVREGPLSDVGLLTARGKSSSRHGRQSPLLRQTHTWRKYTDGPLSMLGTNGFLERATRAQRLPPRSARRSSLARWWIGWAALHLLTSRGGALGGAGATHPVLRPGRRPPGAYRAPPATPFPSGGVRPCCTRRCCPSASARRRRRR